MTGKLDYQFCKTHCIFVDDTQTGLPPTIVYTTQTPLDVITEVHRFFGQHLSLEQLKQEEFTSKLNKMHTTKQQDALGEQHQQADSLEGVASAISERIELLDGNDAAPAIRFINSMLSDAIQSNASDIHIEADENSFKLRYRVDGILRTILEPDKRLATLIVSRLKVLSKMDIAEKRLPQDGRFSISLGGIDVDVRASTLPAASSERIVLRILDKSKQMFEFDALGLSQPNQRAILHSIHKPHGIILITGPTGSGKSTSLYAMLTQLTSPANNILTIEDPIEYQLSGISQTQINEKAGYTFVKGLKAILRQDPDIIMIGEIRDAATLSTALQASLTGHLVLSTLHTNNAAGAITRLADLGADRFLIGSCLEAVVAQRLLRKLCNACKQPVEQSVADTLKSRLKICSNSLYTVSGCDKCSDTGYSGRIGIYEVITIDPNLRNLIRANNEQEFIEKQFNDKRQSLLHDALDKVEQGITSIEEALRVVHAGDNDNGQ